MDEKSVGERLGSKSLLYFISLHRGLALPIRASARPCPSHHTESFELKRKAPINQPVHRTQARTQARTHLVCQSALPAYNPARKPGLTKKAATDDMVLVFC